MPLKPGLPDAKCVAEVDVFEAFEKEAFREVLPTRLHVFPWLAGDAFKIDADWSVQPDRAELDAVADRARGTLVGMP